MTPWLTYIPSSTRSRWIPLSSGCWMDSYYKAVKWSYHTPCRRPTPGWPISSPGCFYLLSISNTYYFLTLSAWPWYSPPVSRKGIHQGRSHAQGIHCCLLQTLGPIQSRLQNGSKWRVPDGRVICQQIQIGLSCCNRENQGGSPHNY
jgi:hypothetical protein